MKQLTITDLVYCIQKASTITGDVPVQTEDRYEDFEMTNEQIIGVYIPEPKDKIILIRDGGSKWLANTLLVKGKQKYWNREEPFEHKILGRDTNSATRHYSNGWKIESVEDLGFFGIFITPTLTFDHESGILGANASEAESV